MDFKILCQVSNLMSSWGSWSKISKLQQVRDFSFCGSKSSLLKHTYQVSFWKSNCWGSWSKISTLLQVGDFLGLKVRFWNTRMWCNFGNRKQHFYGFVKKMVQKNQYTYNVPPGSSDYIYTRGRRPSPPEGLCRAEPERGPIVFTLDFIDYRFWHLIFVQKINISVFVAGNFIKL